MKLKLGVLFGFFFAATLFSLQFSSVQAATGAVETTVLQPQISVQACPAPIDSTRMNLAQVAQTDCCKGHKGVCGCRAGKIVCCDNTISPTCTCHSDWHEANLH